MYWGSKGQQKIKLAWVIFLYCYLLVRMKFQLQGIISGHPIVIIVQGFVQQREMLVFESLHQETQKSLLTSRFLWTNFFVTLHDTIHLYLLQYDTSVDDLYFSLFQGCDLAKTFAFICTLDTTWSIQIKFGMLLGHFGLCSGVCESIYVKLDMMAVTTHLCSVMHIKLNYLNHY